MTSGPTSGSSSDVVIIGAGHAGSALAATLRQVGYTGSITVIGDEPHLPYHRPPLSKKFSSPEVLQWLRPNDFYASNSIDLTLRSTVVEIDRDAAKVVLADGSEHGYGTLVLATGSSPRSLPAPGSDADGVLCLRTLEDAEALARAVAPGMRMAIIGGGYVGMEVAAVARSRDTAVTVIEREDRILARVASPELSERLTAYHRERGTEILTDASVDGIRFESGRAVGVTLGDGTEIDCDSVLVGIGAVPNDALARAAGLACEGGVTVDELTRTSDPRILAIGDVAVRPLPGIDRPMRLESIPNVSDQSRIAAALITGSAPPAHETPWFWSDQFDLEVKIAGIVGGAARRVVRPAPKHGGFAVYHLTSGSTVTAVETVNAGSEFMAGKRLIAHSTVVDAAEIADPAIALKDILRGRS